MLALLLSASIQLTFTSSQSHIQIDTKLGSIIGNVRPTKDGTEVYEFLGIQYANSPIGDLRFRQAQLNETWNTKIYDASTYGPWCIQTNQPNSIQSEDCLFLNIWTPSVNKTSSLPGIK